MIIIIAGHSRSGKSTIAKRIAAEMQMNYIPFDSLISTLENLYPEVGIQHLDDNQVFSKKLAGFVDEFITHISYEEIDVVIDLYQLFPEDYEAMKNKQETEILYVGSPHVNSEEKLVDLRRFEREKDWTRDVSDDEMMKILEGFLGEGVQMAQQCEKLGIPFIDTSHRFEEAIEESVEFLRKAIQTRRSES
jgi:adenylate kinase family enzyme